MADRRSEPDRHADARRALIEQVSHLAEEVDALRGHLALLPEEVLTGRPVASDPSFKEIYFLLAGYDEQVFTPALERLADGESGDVEIRVPTEQEVLGDASANDVEMEEIIGLVAATRTKTAGLLQELGMEEWKQPLVVDGEQTDVFGLAYAIVQHDADLLRAAAYRLHESRLGSREEDLPK